MIGGDANRNQASISTRSSVHHGLLRSGNFATGPSSNQCQHRTATMMPLSNKVPSHLTIRILYSDDDIVVVDKPCDLRSVPGHANPPPSGDGVASIDHDTAPPTHRRTAQEAWVQAIQFMSSDKITISDPGDEDVAVWAELLRNLGNTADPTCVPRKLDTFVKYCHRNSKRLLPSFPDLHAKKDTVLSKNDQCDQPMHKKSKIDYASSSILGRISHACYVKIQKEQRLLMNLPKPTEDWESAIGQLRILGFGDYSHNVSPIGTESRKLFVVHRLDCQVSRIKNDCHSC